MNPALRPGEKTSRTLTAERFATPFKALETVGGIKTGAQTSRTVIVDVTSSIADAKAFPPFAAAYRRRWRSTCYGFAAAGYWRRLQPTTSEPPLNARDDAA